MKQFRREVLVVGTDRSINHPLFENDAGDQTSPIYGKEP